MIIRRLLLLIPGSVLCYAAISLVEDRIEPRLPGSEPLFDIVRQHRWHIAIFMAASLMVITISLWDILT